jgi:hypothetical protein
MPLQGQISNTPLVRVVKVIGQREEEVESKYREVIMVGWMYYVENRESGIIEIKRSVDPKFAYGMNEEWVEVR